MKAVKWGIGLARNEAEDIRGWAKTMLYFAEKVICIVDPATTDDTDKILRKEFPKINVIFQDRSLGDSDNQIIGRNKIMIAHKNLERVVNQYVKKGEWVFMLAPDERFNPNQWKDIDKMIKMIKKYQLAGSVSFPSIHNFIDENHCIDYYSHFRFGSLIQMRFMRRDEYWKKGGPPHSGYDIPTPIFISPYPLYHYCWLKKTRKPFDTWRDNRDFKYYPTYFLKNPINNWRDLHG